MINILNKLRGLVNKISPTATQVHVPVPMSREDKIKKIVTEYDLVNNKMKEIDDKNRVDSEPSSVSTNNDDSDIYRGKSF